MRERHWDREPSTIQIDKIGRSFQWLIRGRDRVHIKNSDLIAKLSQAIDYLPDKLNYYKFKGLNPLTVFFPSASMIVREMMSDR